MNNIDEFYEYSKNLNINEIGGWAPCYYGVYSHIIKEYNYKNVSELGVGYGTHARYVLLNNPEIESLTLIDPMKEYENDAFADDIKRQNSVLNINNFDRIFQLINNDLSKISNKYKWIRKESKLITDEDLPNNSLDCIFIDGDHSYNAVINDLELYWKKIRIGGQILGDDYNMLDVSNAVNDFSNKYNLKYDLLFKKNSNHPIYRFFKN